MRSRHFLYITADDIAQEARRICFEAICQYRPNEGSSIKTYLSRCVSNRLNNLKRDTFFRIENPCIKNKCPMYNIFTKSCMSNNIQEDCQDLLQSREKVQRQIGAVSNASIGEVDTSNYIYDDTDIEFNQLKGEIRDAIILASGDIFGLYYDVLIAGGSDYISSDVWDFIKGTAMEHMHVES